MNNFESHIESSLTPEHVIEMGKDVNDATEKARRGFFQDIERELKPLANNTARVDRLHKIAHDIKERNDESFDWVVEGLLKMAEEIKKQDIDF